MKTEKKCENCGCETAIYCRCQDNSIICHECYYESNRQRSILLALKKYESKEE